jgi:23S rRNA maturation mini-RNase III
LTIKLKVLHFNTVEVIEAESQAVLNSLTEHDFQDVSKKWQKRGNGA